MSAERDWISSCSLISLAKYLKADCERRNRIKIIRATMSLNIYFISISHSEYEKSMAALHFIAIVCGFQIQRIDFVITCVQCSMAEAKKRLNRCSREAMKSLVRKFGIAMRFSANANASGELICSNYGQPEDWFLLRLRSHNFVAIFRCDWKNPLVLFTFVNKLITTLVNRPI